MIEDLRALPGTVQSLAVMGVGLVSFAVALLLIRSGVVTWDERLFMAFNKGTGSNSIVARVVAAVTTPIALAILVVVAALVVNRSHGTGAVVVSVAAASLGWALANGAKLLIDRPRPYLALVRGDPSAGPCEGYVVPFEPHGDRDGRRGRAPAVAAEALEGRRDRHHRAGGLVAGSTSVSTTRSICSEGSGWASSPPDSRG